MRWLLYVVGMVTCLGFAGVARSDEAVRSIADKAI